MPPRYDLTGKRVSKLTVISLFPKKPGINWLCKCDCGKECVRTTSLINDTKHPNKSCGCASWVGVTKFEHPHKLKLHGVIGAIISRCYRPANNRYKSYGGRGITVCAEWKNSRTAFFEWAIATGYKPGLTIDRKNNNGNYCPDNCRWTTNAEQQANTTKTRRLTWNGETLTITEWAYRLGVARAVLVGRIDKQWTNERIFTQPFRTPHARTTISA